MLRQLGRMLRTPQARGFGLGMGVVLLGILLLPKARRVVRPLAKGVVKGALGLAEGAARAAAEAREELQEIVMEAQWERAQEAMNAQRQNSDGVPPPDQN